MTRPAFITRKQELPLKGDSTSLFLQVIISIAVFIFAITLSGVLSINSILENWHQSILGSLTVQIMPTNDSNPEKALAETLAYQDKAIEFLQTVEGIIKVTPLNDEQLKNLIQPWLGDGVNIDKLKQMIFDKTMVQGYNTSQFYLSNARHIECVNSAKIALDTAIDSFTNTSLDFVVADIHTCWQSLGEVSGVNSNERIIDRIFEKFCLGK